MASPEPMWKSIDAIHDAFDSRRISPTELAREYLGRAKADSSNAFLTLSADRALLQAEAADRLIASEGRVPRERLPLFGIPLAIKDNLVTEGLRTTCGSRMLENYVPPYTATCVARLESAGAITLGKTNLDEFGMGGSNENSAFGPVLHPTHRDRVPGGSSGGSAAAVRADLSFAAVGTDTGGSIRLPASYCGIVGLKPTYGRVSRYGLVAFASSLDQAGPMTRTVIDSAKLLDAMAGHDPMDSTSSRADRPSFSAAAAKAPDFSRLRVGVPAELFSEGVSPETAAAIESALRWLESRGARRVPVRLPHAKHSIAVYYLVAVSEASSNLSRFDGVRFGTRSPEAAEAADLAEFYRKNRAAFGDEVKRRILLGTFSLSAGYQDAYYRKACQVRRLIQGDLFRAFEEADVIVSPVSPSQAYKLGEKSSDPLQMYLNDLFTLPASLAGLPAISVPCGEDSLGLSIGMQLTGPAFDEAGILSIARAFEAARDEGEVSR